MKLLVALDNDGKAEGELFWDDGNSVGEFEYRDFIGECLIKYEPAHKILILIT